MDKIDRLARVALPLLTTILQAALMFWTACLPLAWIVRDGLGPDSVDSVWPRSLFKFLGLWGIPALCLALPLFLLLRVEKEGGQE